MSVVVVPAGAVSASSPVEELEEAVKASWAAFCAGQQTRAAHYKIVGWAIDARRIAAAAARPSSSGWGGGKKK